MNIVCFEPMVCRSIPNSAFPEIGNHQIDKKKDHNDQAFLSSLLSNLGFHVCLLFIILGRGSTHAA